MDDRWAFPIQPVHLSGDEVHVWRADLNLDATTIDSLTKSLSRAEIIRAERFRFASDRRQFIASHGALRSILAHYLSIKPERLHFSFGEFGKPALSDCLAETGIHFNMSHSHGIALYAIARRRHLGIDIEYIKPDVATEATARHFFSAPEVLNLQALPRERREAAFFACWARKESYVKARGEGLSLPLHNFEVSVIPEEKYVTLHVNGNPAESARWSIQSLTVDSNYSAALTVEGHRVRIRCWQWQYEQASPSALAAKS